MIPINKYILLLLLLVLVSIQPVSAAKLEINGIQYRETWNGEYVNIDTPPVNISTVSQGYETVWAGGKHVLKWDGVYAYDWIVNASDSSIVSTEWFSVQSQSNTGQKLWQYEAITGNTFQKIDNQTIRRIMTLDSGGKFNVTYHYGWKIKIDFEVTAGYNRNYLVEVRSDLPASQRYNSTINNNSKKYTVLLDNSGSPTYYDWNDIPEYQANPITGQYVAGFNTTSWLSVDGRKFYQTITVPKKLNVSEKITIDPAYFFNGSTTPVWQNSTLDNVTYLFSDSNHLTISSVYDDDFENGSTINSKWSWIREPVGKYFQNNGYLQINTTNTDIYEATNTAPLLLQNSSNENFTIITKISSTPDSNYEQGGIIFYSDDDNYVKLSYAYTVGIKANLIREDNATSAQTSLSITSDPIYLKLIKSGTSYTGYYSIIRTVWTEIATYTLPDSISKIGITAFDSGINSAEPVQFINYVTNKHITTGNFITWHDSGSGNETYQIDINATTPANTNYTVRYANNGTGSWTQLGGTLTGNNSLTISGTKYQNTDVQVQFAGNQTATPEIMGLVLYTQNASGAQQAYNPPSPTNLSSTQGNFWVNYTWLPGIGNTSDSYNVSVNGTWTNGSLVNFSNTTVLPHGWANISVWAFNSSGSGSLNLTNISSNTQVSNNIPVLASIGAKSIEEDTLLSFTISATDADTDTLSYAQNGSGSINSSTGEYTWTPPTPGTYFVNFSANDSYGGLDFEVVEITVSSAPIVDTNTTPALSSVTNQTAQARYTIITYTVNQSNAITRVRYGITQAMTSSTTNQTTGTNRQDNLTPLLNNTPYYYTVDTWNSTNTSHYTNSTIQSFTTAEDYVLPSIGAPLITSYTPADLTPVIDVNNLATFNAGANQSVTWTWTGVTEGAGDGTPNSTATNTWTTTGAKTVTATCTNANGSCGTIQWDVTVVSDGSGGGTNYDWLSGTVTPTGSTITINPSVSGSPTTGGAYSFGYVFISGQTYWVNVSKAGYYGNNTSVVFNEDHEILDITLIEIPYTAAPVITGYNNTYSGGEVYSAIPTGTSNTYTVSSYIGNITDFVWSLDGTTVGTTTNAYTTSLNHRDSGGNLRYIRVYGNGTNGTSNTIEWRMSVMKALAVTPLIPLNDSAYDASRAALSNFSLEDSMAAIMGQYTGVLSDYVYLFIWGIIFVMIWIRQGSITIPSTIGLILGSIIIGTLPENFQFIAQFMIAMGGFALVYIMFSERR